MINIEPNRYHTQNQFINSNDKLYLVKQVLFEREFLNRKNDNIMNDYRDYIGCDKIFRREGMIYFCELIEEATIIN